VPRIILPSIASRVVAAAVATLLVVSNLTEMRGGADRLHRFTDFVRPGLAAVDLAVSMTQVPAFLQRQVNP